MRYTKIHKTFYYHLSSLIKNIFSLTMPDNISLRLERYWSSDLLPLPGGTYCEKIGSSLDYI